MSIHPVIQELEDCGFLPTLHFAMNEFKREVVQVPGDDEPLCVSEVEFERGSNTAIDPYRISLPGFAVNLFHHVTQRGNVWCIPVNTGPPENHRRTALGVAPEFYPYMLRSADGRTQVKKQKGPFTLRTFDFLHMEEFEPVALVMEHVRSATNLHGGPPQQSTYRIYYEYRLEGSRAVHQIAVEVTFKMPAHGTASSAHSLAHAVGRRRAGERVEVLTSPVY